MGTFIERSFRMFNLAPDIKASATFSVNIGLFGFSAWPVRSHVVTRRKVWTSLGYLLYYLTKLHKCTGYPKLAQSILRHSNWSQISLFSLILFRFTCHSICFPRVSTGRKIIETKALKIKAPLTKIGALGLASIFAAMMGAHRPPIRFKKLEIPVPGLY